MSLITCGECSKDMSDTAKSCPHCGKENIKTPQRSISFILGVGILFIPLIFSWFTLRKGYSKKSKIISFLWLAISIAFFSIPDNTDFNINLSVKSAVPKEEVTQVNIKDLLSNYKQNEISADKKYQNKVIQFTGIVSNVKKDIMNNPYVTLGTGSKFEIPEVQAFFDDSMANQLGDLRKGSRLTVACRIDGLMMNVLAKECVIK